jgi:hypothetical protein
MNTIFVLRLAVVGAALAAVPSGPTSDTKKVSPATRFVSGENDVDPRRKQIDAILDSKIDLKFHEMPLLDTLAGIRSKTGLNFYMETRYLPPVNGDQPQLPVTIDVAGITVRSALNLILRDSKLAWFYGDEVIVITTEDAVALHHETRVYTVGDLVVREDGSWPHNRYVQRTQMDGGVGPNTEVDDLIEMITSTIAPTTWAEVGGTASIKFLPAAQALTVVQSRAAHDDIEALLTKLREARKSQLGAVGLPNPGDLLLASYAMPRHAPTWNAPWPGSPATDANAQRYEAELKTSLANAAATAREFATVIPQVIEPESWKTSGGKGEIFVVNDRLVIRQTAAVHAQVANLLRENAPPRQGTVGNTGS